MRRLPGGGHGDGQRRALGRGELAGADIGYPAEGDALGSRLLDELVNQAMHDVLARHPVRFGDLAQYHVLHDVEVQRQRGEQIVVAVGALAAVR